MPIRNIVKSYGDEQFYHIYSRGLNKQTIFHDQADYDYFLMLFARYLSDAPVKSPSRTIYPHYGERLELLAFCLMPNHIHMLIYQQDATAMPECMRAIMTSYSIYYNKRYNRRGPLFESHYLASIVDSDTYLQHISRYIHLNPREWQHYPYSSIAFYTRNKSSEWLKPQMILGLFNDNPISYLSFVKDYEGQKAILDSLKQELAHE